MCECAEWQSIKTTCTDTGMKAENLGKYKQNTWNNTNKTKQQHRQQQKQQQEQFSFLLFHFVFSSNNENDNNSDKDDDTNINNSLINDWCRKMARI